MLALRNRILLLCAMSALPAGPSGTSFVAAAY